MDGGGMELVAELRHEVDVEKQARLSHRMYLLISLRMSTHSQNRQLIVYCH